MSYDIVAQSGGNVSIPVRTDPTGQTLTFRYSTSSSLRDAVDILVNPIVINNKNVTVTLPPFSTSLYYVLFSTQDGVNYWQNAGQITYVSEGESPFNPPPKPGTGGSSVGGPNSVTSETIVDGTIRNIDISTSANIAPSKIAGIALTTADVRPHPSLPDVLLIG